MQWTCQLVVRQVLHPGGVDGHSSGTTFDSGGSPPPTGWLDKPLLVSTALIMTCLQLRLVTLLISPRPGLTKPRLKLF